MAEAERRGALVAVAVVDRRGDPIQQDGMDGSATAAGFLAPALAATAATFELPSEEVAGRVPQAMLDRLLPYATATIAGGVPVVRAGAWSAASASPAWIRLSRPRSPPPRSRPRRDGAHVRVCIVGTGAIGSLFAAHLGRLPDVEVWAYDVSPAHVDAINADGLRITGAADFRAEVRASTDPSRIPPCDLGIVAVKSAYTDVAIAATAADLPGRAPWRACRTASATRSGSPRSHRG